MRKLEGTKIRLFTKTCSLKGAEIYVFLKTWSEGGTLFPFLGKELILKGWIFLSGFGKWELVEDF